jgi:NAD(P)-dependent dehydrogenase (short-subunit alcohol dehydrogenase family)
VTDQRTALVTGGADALGAAIVAVLRADGLRVLAVDVEPGEGVDVVADVADPAGMSGVRAAVGPVDILVNSAGVAGPGAALVDVEDEEWARTIEVGLSGTFHVCRAFLPDMVDAGWGRVVNLAGVPGAAAGAQVGGVVDAAAASGVVGLTKALARELASTGVLVNAVVPVPRPGQVAELVAWLASDRCSFSTGVVYDLS